MNFFEFSGGINRSKVFFGLVLFVFGAVFAPENLSGQAVFFMRYEHPNIEELRKNIDDAYKILDEAGKNRQSELFLQTSIDLGEMLTVAGREREAVALLEPLLGKSDTNRAKPEDRAWLYLNYATANQYLRRKNKARAFFNKALELTRKHDLENVEHYVFHHYGRFLVEDREFETARKYFEKALKIRRKLNDRRIGSTQKALDELKRMKTAPRE